MPKLYFRYGTVGSAKTLNLLAVAHNYRQQGKRVILMKPALDVRFGKDSIRSRAGLNEVADILITDSTHLIPEEFDGISCILVDEAQFLPASVIEQLRELTINPGLPVICYGLRTDFTTKAFAASQRLLEIADAVEEVKTTCTYCDRKATVNLKLVNGKPVCEGPQIELGCEELYLPTCFACYRRSFQN